MSSFLHLRCLLLIGVALSLVGCSTTTGTISRDPLAYIRLVGITATDSTQVDDLAPVALVPKDNYATLRVAPGKHRIRVLRGGAVLVDRSILVSDLQTLEITVP